MPEEKNSPIRRSGPPPPSGRAPAAKARGPVDPIDAPEVVASTEPEDSLEDYIVPPDPEPVPDPDAPDRLAAENTVSAHLEASQVTTGVLPAGPVTTADTELVHRLQRELAAAQARLAGVDADVSAWSTGTSPSFKDGETLVIHVREDGFTANGRVWYRGQELEFTVGAQNYRDTCDRYGNSWLALDDAGQIRRWGQVMFGHGPWPGLPFDNERAAVAERNRGRVAPVIQRLTAQKPQLRT